MDWEDGVECRSTEMGKSLVIDYQRNNAINGGEWGECSYLPSGAEKAQDILNTATIDEDDDWYDEVGKSLKESCHLTLHVLNVREFQVMTVLDKTRFDASPDFSGEADLCIPGYVSPNLYGVPPEGSPYYRNFTDSDFPSSGYDYPPKGMEIFEIRGCLDMSFEKYVKTGDAMGSAHDFDDDTTLRFRYKNEGIDLVLDGISVHFCMYCRSAIRICSFLRALMKEKCARVIGPQIPLVDDISAPLTQPFWVATDKILDRVTSYASFEDQAGKLRLVCKKFESSALRQLRGKLDKVKVIGFHNDSSETGPSWFRVSARHGWSEECLTSEESAIEEALWFTSCRCSFKKCENKEGCPSVGKPVQYMDHGTTKTLDIEEARNKLATKGWIWFSEPDEWEMEDDYYVPDRAECSFKREEMNVFEVCIKVGEIINERLSHDLLFEGQECMLDRYLKRDYGVSGDITSSRFVRSMFLVFAKASTCTSVNNEEEEVPTKKARKASINEVTVGMAKAYISVEGGTYSRMKKVFRFYSAAREPIEILIESKISCEY